MEVGPLSFDEPAEVDYRQCHRIRRERSSTRRRAVDMETSDCIAGYGTRGGGHLPRVERGGYRWITPLYSGTRPNQLGANMRPPERAVA